MNSALGVKAYAEHSPSCGWYVFWETASAFGCRGEGLTKEQAEALAELIRTGQEQADR